MSTTQPEALRENYTAADMATASAQGFRDGVASVAASAGSEPVAWGIFDSQGFYEAAHDQGSAERFCAHYNKRKGADPLKPYTASPLYTHPSPPEGMVGGWMPIETAPKDGTYRLLWEQYSTNPFVGCWAFGAWRVSHEHVDAEGGWGGANVVDSISQDRITHWMSLPLPPTTSAGSGKGE